MVQAHVVFTGIVALVPRYDGSFRMILPNASRHPDHPHVAHMLAERACVSGWPFTYRQLHPQNHKDLSVWLLDGHSVKILNPISSSSVTPVRKYIASIDDAVGKDYPHAADISPLVFLSEDSDVVAARVDIPGGNLQATYVRADTEWYYLPNHGSGAQWRSLAQEVCVTFDVDGQLELEITRFSSGLKYSAVVSPNSKNAIEVRFGNVPKDNVVHQGYAETPFPVDHHFSIYYQMSATPPGEEALPNSRQKNHPDNPPLDRPPQIDVHTHEITIDPPAGPTFLASSGHGHMHSPAEEQAIVPPSNNGLVGVGGADCPPGMWNAFNG